MTPEQAGTHFLMWCLETGRVSYIDEGAVRAAIAMLKPDTAKDAALGQLARRCLSLDSIDRERGDLWLVARLRAHGPDAAAFVTALRAEEGGRDG